MTNADQDLDGSALEDEAEPPAPSPLSSPGGSPRITEMLWDTDNRMVEDMELSDEETGSSGIIGKELRDDEGVWLTLSVNIITVKLKKNWTRGKQTKCFSQFLYDYKKDLLGSVTHY